MKEKEKKEEAGEAVHISNLFAYLWKSRSGPARVSTGLGRPSDHRSWYTKNPDSRVQYESTGGPGAS